MFPKKKLFKKIFREQILTSSYKRSIFLNLKFLIKMVIGGPKLIKHKSMIQSNAGLSWYSFSGRYNTVSSWYSTVSGRYCTVSRWYGTVSDQYGTVSGRYGTVSGWYGTVSGRYGTVLSWYGKSRVGTVQSQVTTLQFLIYMLTISHQYGTILGRYCTIQKYSGPRPVQDVSSPKQY